MKQSRRYALWVLLAVLAAPVAPAAAPPALPNILLLVAEDLSPRIGAFGDDVAQTPNLDELARAGVRFTRVFTTAGVCAPSRAALITGLHQISFGAQHMRTSTAPLGEYYARPPEDLKAFPEWLRRAGYFTFTDGKLDYQFSGIGAGSGPFTIWDAEGPAAHWSQRAPAQPFFGLINFAETHESGLMRVDGPPVDEMHRMARQRRLEAGLVAPAVTDPADVLLPPYYPDIPEVRSTLARHYDNVHAMDARVGRILDRLEADGLREHTIVVWTADHGDGLPRAKRELYDSGIHVPMIVYLPPAFAPTDWQPGSADDALVSFVDVAPTILRWAGIEPPPRLHGRSLFASRRDHVFASRDRLDEVLYRERAVRDHRYKYIRSWSPDTAGGAPLAYRDILEMVRAMRALHAAGRLSPEQARWFEPPGEEQLYDLDRDPHELVNRVDDPALADVRARLRSTLIDALVRFGDTAIVPEDEMRQRLLDDGAVPVTPPPLVEWTAGTLRARARHGASIGFRADQGPWQLYTGPVAVPAQGLEVKAVRYGWRESPSVILMTGP